MGRLGKVGIRGVTDATGIDDLERDGPRLTDSGKAVTRDPGLIMDNRHTAAHQAVEEGGLAHIGAPDNGNASHESDEGGVGRV